MTEELLLYHNPMSRGRIARWMLEELGEPYRVEVLRFDEGEHKTPEYLAINPMGKVPTLVHKVGRGAASGPLHGDTVVTETGAICAYLADAFPDAGLAPAVSDPARGTYYRWLFFGSGCVEQALVDRMAGRPEVERGRIGYGSWEDTFAALDQALQPGPYLLGDTFTAADVYIGSQLAWGAMTEALKPSAVAQAYLERLRARPASQRANEKDAEIIAGWQAQG